MPAVLLKAARHEHLAAVLADDTALLALEVAAVLVARIADFAVLEAFPEMVSALVAFGPYLQR